MKSALFLDTGDQASNQLTLFPVSTNKAARSQNQPNNTTLKELVRMATSALFVGHAQPATLEMLSTSALAVPR